MKDRYIDGALIAFVLVSLLAFLFAVGVIIGTDDAYGATALEYQELTSVLTTSGGTEMRGDVLVCVYGTFTGTVYLEFKHTQGSSQGEDEWFKTGDSFTEPECIMITIPESDVEVRASSSISDGTAKFRASQTYPTVIRVK